MSKKLFATLAALAVIASSAFAGEPVIAGITQGTADPGYTTVAFAKVGADHYSATFSNLVLVFKSDPGSKFAGVAKEAKDSHGNGKVWLVPASAANGAVFQFMGVGKEWGKVVFESPLEGGSATVTLPYKGNEASSYTGWQPSTGKVVAADGSWWAWASKAWPHDFEAYDKCGNPMNVWGAGKNNLGAAVTPDVREKIKAALRCPPGQAAKN
jgi:hypothetical protein